MVDWAIVAPRPVPPGTDPRASGPETLTMTVYIAPDSIRPLTALLAKAQRALPELRWTFGEPRPVRGNVYTKIRGAYDRIELVPAGHYFRTLLTLDVEVPAISHDGWRVVARRTGETALEWTNPGTTLAESEAVRAGLPARYTTCEACGLSRARVGTLVLQDAAGRTLQVGGACIAKYVPARLVAAIDALAVALTQVQAAADGAADDTFGGEGGYRPSGWLSLESILSGIAEVADDTYVPSRDTQDQPNKHATWRRVQEIASHRDTHIALGTAHNYAEPDHGVLNLIRESNPEAAGMVDRLVAEGATDTKGVAYFVGAWRRAVTARPATSEVPQVLPPAGRQTLEGTIVSTKLVDGFYGSVTKVLVDCGGFRLFGTLPATGCGTRGAKVQWACTVEPKEAGFGFFSRPTKWTETEAVAEAAA